MGKGSSRDGFTLIELVVVLILIGISVALVAPKISHSLERAQFRKDIRSVSTMLTLARSQAIAHKVPYALSIDLDKHRVWVDTAQQQNAKQTKHITRLALSHTDTLQVKAQKHEKATRHTRRQQKRTGTQSASYRVQSCFSTPYQPSLSSR